ncbi:hypothetical protein C3488_23685 [Streptomyces sp. Ru72]|nr:hypothetical protein C3488_23685 [Streptomyces sp. Ru72]
MLYLVQTALAVGSVVAAVTIMLIRRDRRRTVASPQARLMEAAATRGAGSVGGQARAYTRFARRF